MQVNYSYSYSDGYLNNPYKVLSLVDGDTGDTLSRETPLPPDGGPSGRFLFENRPDERTQHSIYTQAKYNMDGKVLDLSYRFMTADLLDFATTLYDLSDGRFDITSGVLREVWTFDGSDRVPEPGSVEAVFSRVGWSRAWWERPVLTLAPRMEIDLGGIGKEYAVDRCIAIVAGSRCAPGLVNFGADLAVSGPPTRRRAWKVAVEGVG